MQNYPHRYLKQGGFNPLLSRRNTGSWFWNVIDDSRRNQRQRLPLKAILFQLILVVVPFPIMMMYFIEKPKYIIALFFTAILFQLCLAALNDRNRAAMFITSMAALTLMTEAVIYAFYTAIN